MFEQLWKDEEGLTTVEYGLLFLLVEIATIITWTCVAPASAAQPPV